MQGELLDRAEATHRDAHDQVVDLHEKQTGNEVKLGVTPYGGMLEKARDAVRAANSPQHLHSRRIVDDRVCEGSFLKPFAEIDQSFSWPIEVPTFEDSNYRNAQRRWRTRHGRWSPSQIERKRTGR